MEGGQDEVIPIDIGTVDLNLVFFYAAPRSSKLSHNQKKSGAAE